MQVSRRGLAGRAHSVRHDVPRHVAESTPDRAAAEYPFTAGMGRSDVSWERREHTADLRVHFDAADLETLFRDATDLIRTLVAGESAQVSRRLRRTLSLRADAVDELLFAWLRELLFLFDTERFVPGALDLRAVSRTALEATIRGEPFDPRRHAPQPEVKAVTRHGLTAIQRDDGWEAEVVFDL